MKRFTQILFLMLCLLGVTNIHAQVTIGSNYKPNSNALLDLRENADSSSTKGVLFPRVALTSTVSPSPMSSFTKGLIVYNTAIAGVSPNNVITGFYYSDGTKWFPISGGNWYINGTVVDAGNSKSNSIYRTGRVGIGTNPIDSSAVLDLSGVSDKGFLGPKVALSSSTDKVTVANPATGLLVYNLGTKGLKTIGYLYWSGSEWVKFATRTSVTASVNALGCSNAYLTPKSYVAGTAYVGTLVVPYTGGNGGSYSAGTAIASTGVTGLTATLQQGDLEYGTGQLVYNVTGTPSQSSPELATFAIDFGSLSCSASVGASALSRGEAEYYSGGKLLASATNVLLSSTGEEMPTIENTFRFDAYLSITSNAPGNISIRPRVYNISSTPQKFWWMGMTSIEGRGDANVLLAPGGYQNLDNGMYLGYGKNMVLGTSTPATALDEAQNTEGYNFDFIFSGKWYKVEMSFTVDNLNTTSDTDNLRKWYCRITRMF